MAMAEEARAEEVRAKEAEELALEGMVPAVKEKALVAAMAQQTPGSQSTEDTHHTPMARSHSCCPALKSSRRKAHTADKPKELCHSRP
jgi:hypothetical protein